MEAVNPKSPGAEVAAKNPGDYDHAIVIEQYRLYVEMMDKIADRRQHANSYFFSLSAGLFAAMAFLYSKDTDESLRPLAWMISLAGIPISMFWHRLIESYRNLATAKFEVIHQMEEHLPFRAYSGEWKILEEGKNKSKYLPLTHLEIWIPRFFMVIFIGLTIWSVPWAFLYNKCRVSESTPVTVSEQAKPAPKP